MYNYGKFGLPHFFNISLRHTLSWKQILYMAWFVYILFYIEQHLEGLLKIVVIRIRGRSCFITQQSVFELRAQSLWIYSITIWNNHKNSLIAKRGKCCTQTNAKQWILFLLLCAIETWHHHWWERTWMLTVTLVQKQYDFIEKCTLIINLFINQFSVKLLSIWIGWESATFK